MGLEISWSVVLFFVLGLGLLYLVGYLLLMPLRKLGRFFFNAFLGGALLLLAKWLLTPLGIAVPLSPFTALITGFLGVPGAVLCFLLQRLFLGIWA